ncbi:MmgE/PrpD family protein [Desulfosarcina variabilis]|uniref:MmgE/PrpD family protein n=1 Tax=Desulfosarcina variabilis TaxID=2300 RepID=UPI003AFA58ED
MILLDLNRQGGGIIRVAGTCLYLPVLSLSALYPIIKTDPLFNLCQFVSRQTIADIPDAVVHQAKRVLRDTLGVMVAGAASMAVGQVARQMPLGVSSRPSTWPGQHGEYHPITAALLGGMAGSTLEFEEGHARAMGHPAIQIVPAVVAAAEAAGLSGTHLIEGLISGYEVACRISQACHLREGLHPNGHWGIIGAALGVATLSRRLPEALVQVANIAAGLTMNPLVNNSFAGCSIACTFAGMAGQAGLMANLFFDSGMRAEPHSLAMTFSRFVSTDFDPVVLATDLGAQYAIGDNYFKPYPTCRFTHAALDALQQILDAQVIDPETIDAIDVYSFKAAVHPLTPPTNLEALRFSIPYLMGMMLAGHGIGLSAFTDQVLDDPMVARLAGKVRLILDPAYDAMRPGHSPARVIIRLNTGRELAAEVLSGCGDQSNPLPEQALVDKFLSLTTPVLGEARARQVLAKIDGLENEADVRGVMRLLRPGD